MSDKVGGQMGKRNRKKVEIGRVEKRIEKEKILEVWERRRKKETGRLKVMSSLPTLRNVLPAAICDKI